LIVFTVCDWFAFLVKTPDLYRDSRYVIKITSPQIFRPAGCYAMIAQFMLSAAQYKVQRDRDIRSTLDSWANWGLRRWPKIQA